VDKALEFHSEESIDPAEGATIAREAYENLFSEPADQYLANMVDTFLVDWEYECRPAT